MINLLVTGDLHLTDDPANEYRHSFMRELWSIAKQRQPDGIVILGDLTQEKDRHSASLVNRVVDHIDALASVAPVVILEGNHDYADEGSPFFAFLSRIPDCTWVGAITDGADIGKQFKSCLFLPHTRRYKEDWKDVDFEAFEICFAHQTFTGASIGFGRQLEGVPLEYIPARASVVSGDIHVPQSLGPVIYAGAPYTINFGDEYTPRLLSIDLPNGRVRSIGVGTFPQKRLVVVGGIEELPTAGFNERDIVKVRIRVDDMGTWHSTKKAIEEWGQEHGLTIQRKEPILEHKAIKRRIKIKESKQSDDHELVEQYGKRHDLDDKTIDMGLAIMEGK